MLMIMMTSHFYHMKEGLAQKILRVHNHKIERIFDFFKEEAKKEDVTAEELIEIDEIEDMNEMSHEIAEHQQKQLLMQIRK